MQFNADIDRMRAFCVFRCEKLFDKSFKSGSRTSLKYHFYSGLQYALEKLADTDFSDVEEFSEQVSQAISFAYDAALAKEAHKALRRLEREKTVAWQYFLKQIRQLDLPVPPYCRILGGEEKKQVCQRIAEVWDYHGFYWYPLEACRVAREECLFVRADLVVPLAVPLRQMLSSARFYEFGGFATYEPEELFLSETDKLTIEQYVGYDYAYIAKDFSWIIYVSHEDIVTFGGRVLAPIKELLADQKGRWNRVVWE